MNSDTNGNTATARQKHGFNFENLIRIKKKLNPELPKANKWDILVGEISSTPGSIKTSKKIGRYVSSSKLIGELEKQVVYLSGLRPFLSINEDYVLVVGLYKGKTPKILHEIYEILITIEKHKVLSTGITLEQANVLEEGWKQFLFYGIDTPENKVLSRQSQINGSIWWKSERKKFILPYITLNGKIQGTFNQRRWQVTCHLKTILDVVGNEYYNIINDKSTDIHPFHSLVGHPI